MTGNDQPPALVRSAEDLDEFYLEDGAPVTESSYQPENLTEKYIHQGLLKRFPGIQCVVHSHARSVIPFGIGGVPFRPTYHLPGSFIGEEAPVFEIADYYTRNDTQNLLISKLRFGEALANTFLTSAHNASAAALPEPDHDVVLQRGHGFTTVGTSIPQAVFRAVYTTWNAEIQSSAVTINDAAGQNRGVRYVMQQELADSSASYGEAYPREWNLWAAQVGVNPLYKNDLGYASIPGSPSA
ncbi:MAG: hypothetical protein Q9200_004678 [Gallowayella weberi]